MRKTVMLGCIRHVGQEDLFAGSVAVQSIG